jgi:hypothetical protein
VITVKEMDTQRMYVLSCMDTPLGGKKEKLGQGEFKV